MRTSFDPRAVLRRELEHDQRSLPGLAGVALRREVERPAGPVPDVAVTKCSSTTLPSGSTTSYWKLASNVFANW